LQSMDICTIYLSGKIAVHGHLHNILQWKYCYP
jgi:hypothetical protein